MAKKSVDWKYNIGNIIESPTRNMTIINKEVRCDYYIHKGKRLLRHCQYYKYHCNICNFESWISLSNLTKGTKCSCCSNHTVVKGINDIATVRPDLIKYFVDINDAYSYIAMSNQKVRCKCPICKTEKYILVYNLTKHGFSCSKCSDGISYPEKFVASVLSQLNIQFIRQYKIDNFKYRYDFYLPQYNTIIETHGEQHFSNTFYKKTLEKVQENDLKKKNVALQNDINNYIEIDCRKSDMNFIKTSIYNIDFFKDNFNIDDVNWNLCHRDSLKNKLIEICEYWNKYSDKLCVLDIMKIFSISRGTALKYLHIGTDIGICYYDKALENKKAGKKRIGEKNWASRKVKQFTKNGKFLKEWDCIKDASKEVNGFGCNITKCCKGYIRYAYGYIWRYSNDDK